MKTGLKLLGATALTLALPALALAHGTGTADGQNGAGTAGSATCVGASGTPGACGGVPGAGNDGVATPGPVAGHGPQMMQGNGSMGPGHGTGMNPNN